MFTLNQKKQRTAVIPNEMLVQLLKVSGNIYKNFIIFSHRADWTKSGQFHCCNKSSILGLFKPRPVALKHKLTAIQWIFWPSTLLLTNDLTADQLSCQSIDQLINRSIDGQNFVVLAKDY